MPTKKRRKRKYNQSQPTGLPRQSNTRRIPTRVPNRKSTLDLSVFHDYTDKAVLKQLTNKQKKYLKYAEEHRKQVWPSESEYKQLPPERQAEFISNMRDILDGTKYMDSLATNIDNYIAGLEWQGLHNVANRLQRLKIFLSEEDMDELMRELPDLYLFYKDKASEHRSRTQDYSDEGAQEALGDLVELVLNKYNEARNEAMKDVIIKEK